MLRKLIAFACPMLVLVVTRPVAGAETIDNPMYLEWAKWKEGVFFTLRTEGTSEGVKVVTIQTQTLKKLTAEKAVIEMTSSTEFSGQKFQAPPMTAEVPAKFPKVNVDPKYVPKEPKDVPKHKETKGRETLTINGKKLACEWIQIEMQGGIVSKVWYCDDVPGRMVKMEGRTPDGASTMILADWKAEKR